MTIRFEEYYECPGYCGIISQASATTCSIATIAFASSYSAPTCPRCTPEISTGSITLTGCNFMCSPSRAIGSMSAS